MMRRVLTWLELNLLLQPRQVLLVEVLLLSWVVRPPIRLQWRRNNEIICTHMCHYVNYQAKGRPRNAFEFPKKAFFSSYQCCEWVSIKDAFTWVKLTMTLLLTLKLSELSLTAKRTLQYVGVSLSHLGLCQPFKANREREEKSVLGPKKLFLHSSSFLALEGIYSDSFSQLLNGPSKMSRKPLMSYTPCEHASNGKIWGRTIVLKMHRI